MQPLIAPVEAIVADLRAGRLVVLVDEEDRKNEGDLVLAADHVTTLKIRRSYWQFLVRVYALRYVCV
jgi:3,4-dihydroxy-2-butanone 4-phosphate synthase